MKKCQTCFTLSFFIDPLIMFSLQQFYISLWFFQSNFFFHLPYLSCKQLTLIALNLNRKLLLLSSTKLLCFPSWLTLCLHGVYELFFLRGKGRVSRPVKIPMWGFYDHVDFKTFKMINLVGFMMTYKIAENNSIFHIFCQTKDEWKKMNCLILLFEVFFVRFAESL